MTKVQTATWKEFDTGFFSVYPPTKTLYVNISGEPVNVVESVFSDPEETKILLYEGNEYLNYTNLKSITNEDGIIMVRLGQKGETYAINDNTES